MMVTLEEDAHSYSMVKKWDAEFKRGRDSLEDDPCRRSVTVTTQETIAKIHDVVMADRWVMEYYIATELGISQDHIHAVIHNELHMAKMSAHYVPKLLGLDLKQTQLNMSRENLQRFVTMDETWVYHFHILSKAVKTGNT